MLWSDGSLRSCDVGKGGSGLDSGKPSLVADPITKFGAFDLKSSTATAMTATSSSHVLVVGNDTKGSLSAMLWDTAYSTLQAEIQLDQVPNIGLRTKAGAVAALRKGPTCAVVATQSSVVAMDIAESAASGTLAGALNKLSSGSAKLASDWNAVVSTPAVAHALSFKANACSTKPGEDWVSRGVEREAELAKLLARILDQKKTSTFELLTKALDEYLDMFTTTTETGVGPKAKKQKVREHGGFQHHAIQMLERFLAEKRFFPGKPIVRVLKRHCVSYSHCPAVLEAGLGTTRQHQAVLHAAMEHLDGIDESVVLSCLDRLLARKDTTETPADHESELDAFLRLLFARSWNDVLVVQGLQRCGMDQAIYVLNNLKWWLGHYAEKQQATISKHKTVPTLSQIVDWVGYVVDAKFTALVSSADSHELLREINAMILVQNELCERMKDIPGTKIQFITRKSMPKSHGAIGAYSIEVLTI